MCFARGVSIKLMYSPDLSIRERWSHAWPTKSKERIEKYASMKLRIVRRLAAAATAAMGVLRTTHKI